MKAVFKPLLALGIATASLGALSVPATAQVVKGIGVINIQAVVVNSQAFQTAQTQRKTTYASQIQQAETRRQQISAQLKPLIDKFNTDRQGGKVTQQALQQQATQIQQIQQSGQSELQQMLAPVQASQEYVNEQIQDQLDAAIKAAASKKNITMVFDSSQGQLVYADNAYNLSPDVVTELNTLLPNVQVTPPAGWVPREVREQQQEQAAAQQQQGQAQSRPQVQGR